MTPDELRKRSKVRVPLDGAIYGEGDVVQNFGNQLEVMLCLSVR